MPNVWITACEGAQGAAPDALVGREMADDCEGATGGKGVPVQRWTGNAMGGATAEARQARQARGRRTLRAPGSGVAGSTAADGAGTGTKGTRQMQVRDRMGAPCSRWGRASPREHSSRRRRRLGNQRHTEM